MTTMDSDSASQDSDDGRRFRFEATRKDSNSAIDSPRKKSSSSPRRREASRRSRSREHKSRQRYDRSRERQEEHRKRRESGDSRARESWKNARIPEKMTPHSAYRGTSPKCERRERARSAHGESKRAGEYSSQQEHDGKDSSERRGEKYREPKRFSRDRSREKNAQSSGTKPCDFSRSRDQCSVADSGSRKKSRSIEPSSGKSWIETTKKLDKHPQEYKELNLSDFDIISDTEEITSDESCSRRSHDREKSQILENDEDFKRKVSKNHYERLLKRQATKKRRSSSSSSSSSEESNSSKRMNGSGEAEGEANFLCDEKNANDSKANISSEKVWILEDVGDESEGEAANERSWGPALPPKQRDKLVSRSRHTADKKIDKIPRILGPELPANFRPCETINSEDDVEDAFGPVLPPHLNSRKNQETAEKTPISGSADDDDDNDDDDDDGYVGPLPADHPGMENDMVQHQLEMRARRLKAELAACDKEDEKKREEWMIELPPAKGPNLGLGPRKFRTRPAPDLSDRSSWTDTPADRARKRMEQLENKPVYRATVSKERVGEARIEPERSPKRPKSLMEIHQKKMHKKKKKEDKEAKKNGKTTERRPFDRDVDLRANRFDEARKKNMFLHARHLDDRFSHGKI